MPMAIITFVILLGFRATCYYYRKAGYRSLFMLAGRLRGARAAREVHR